MADYLLCFEKFNRIVGDVCQKAKRMRFQSSDTFFTSECQLIKSSLHHFINRIQNIVIKFIVNPETSMMTQMVNQRFNYWN